MDAKTLRKEIPGLFGYFKALCESFSEIFEFVYPFRNADAELMELKKEEGDAQNVCHICELNPEMIIDLSNLFETVR